MPYRYLNKEWRYQTMLYKYVPELTYLPTYCTYVRIITIYALMTKKSCVLIWKTYDSKSYPKTGMPDQFLPVCYQIHFLLRVPFGSHLKQDWILVKPSICITADPSYSNLGLWLRHSKISGFPKRKKNQCTIKLWERTWAINKLSDPYQYLLLVVLERSIMSKVQIRLHCSYSRIKAKQESGSKSFSFPYPNTMFVNVAKTSFNRNDSRPRRVW